MAFAQVEDACSFRQQHLPVWVVLRALREDAGGGVQKRERRQRQARRRDGHGAMEQRTGHVQSLVPGALGGEGREPAQARRGRMGSRRLRGLAKSSWTEPMARSAKPPSQ